MEQLVGSVSGQARGGLGVAEWVTEVAVRANSLAEILACLRVGAVEDAVSSCGSAGVASVAAMGWVAEKDDCHD